MIMYVNWLEVGWFILPKYFHESGCLIKVCCVDCSILPSIFFKFWNKLFYFETWEWKKSHFWGTKPISGDNDDLSKQQKSGCFSQSIAFVRPTIGRERLNMYHKMPDKDTKPSRVMLVSKYNLSVKKKKLL